MNPRTVARILDFERRIIPAVDLIRTAQVVKQGTDPVVADSVITLCREIRRLEGLMPRAQIAATVADLGTWFESGFTGVPTFDATRDAVPAPRDGEAAAFIGPVTLPNSDCDGAFLEAFSVVREDPECIGELHAEYPHPKAVFQSTRLLSASQGLREGNCVVFFPENIPTEKRIVKQSFAWFFFNRHADIYRRTLSIAAELCGPGSPFAGESRLCSADVDPEDVYQARCVWGYIHDYFHHTGPRPLDQNLAVKTKWRPGVLEELKVDMQSAIACYEGRVPYGDIVFEYIILERLLRYPAQPQPLRNFDSGTGYALGTWLAESGLFTVDEHGQRRLGSKDEIAASARELIALIEDIEKISEDEAYCSRATEFLYENLLFKPEHKGDRYGGPRAPLSLWGAEVYG